MNKRILELYYNPMILKFSEDALKNNNVSLQDFIDWYSTYKKVYTSSKTIINILKDLNSPLVDPFSEYVKNNNDTSFYKNCVKLGYTDTNKILNNDLQKLSGKDIEKLPFEDALLFCTNSQDNYLIVNNRIIILKLLNCKHVEKLNELKNERLERVQYLRDIANNLKLRIKFVKEIDVHMEGLDLLEKKDVGDIIQLVKQYTYKKKIMKVIEYVIKNKEKIEKIKKYLSYEYTTYNKVDFFFLNRKDHSLFDIFNKIMEEHEEGLHKTSAYVDSRITDYKLRIVNFLEYIDGFISKVCKEKVDPILNFFHTCTESQMYDLLLSYGNDSAHDNSKVKSKNSKHHQARHRLTIAVMFLKKLDTICTHCSTYIKSIKISSFLNQIENKSELLDWDKRRVYTDDEVDNMLKMAETTKDKLMITILREIGLRNSAICNLKFKDIIDINRIPKHVCRVKEKGNKIREFVTSDKIKQYIVSYVHEVEQGGILFDEKNKDNMVKFVFSRNKNLDVKMGSATLNNVLKRIGLKAGITNVNIQSHTFRHTLVGKLMDAGNNIEVVSKFIGHSSVDTTMNYYWLKNITELAKEINNPFTQTMITAEEKREEDNFEIDLLNKKIDTCFQIIGIYKNQISEAKTIEELKNTVSSNDIYINKILKYIADSEAGDTTSIRSQRTEWLNAM